MRGAIDNGTSNGTLTNCTFTSNSAPFAGAINNFDAGGLGGSLTLTGCTFTGDTATNGNGGTIYSSLGGNGAGVTVTGSTFSGNQTSNAGGAIFSVVYFGSGAGDTVTVSNTIFTGNSASNGGGVYNPGGGTTVLKGCTFSDNSAANGGGIDNNGAGILDITSSTITGNAAGLWAAASHNRHSDNHAQHDLGQRRRWRVHRVVRQHDRRHRRRLGQVISGNTGGGIDIVGSLATGNLVEGNYIGTNAAGTAAVANTGVGVHHDRRLRTTRSAGSPHAGRRQRHLGQHLDGVEITGTRHDDNLRPGQPHRHRPAGTAAVPNTCRRRRDPRRRPRQHHRRHRLGAGNVIAFNSSSGVVVGVARRIQALVTPL